MPGWPLVAGVRSKRDNNWLFIQLSIIATRDLALLSARSCAFVSIDARFSNADSLGETFEGVT